MCECVQDRRMVGKECYEICNFAFPDYAGCPIYSSVLPTHAQSQLNHVFVLVFVYSVYACILVKLTFSIIKRCLTLSSGLTNVTT